jgi:hypothetical protein
MDKSSLRLHNHKLSQTSFHDPAEVVAYLGAVQAQDYAGAKWALGLRLIGATDATIEQAFNEGHILRTHMMRPTWHFVTPADLGWMLDLTAARVHKVNAGMYAKLELDAAVFALCQDTLIKVLRGGNWLTRAELGTALEQVGIHAQGQRLSYLMMHAELDQVICSGGRRGKQFTYALLDERAPNTQRLPRDAALAELSRRYFTSHGPATVHDFAWWSGLTITEAKTGLESDGKQFWYVSDQELSSMPETLLLPPYDEYSIAYKDYSAVFEPRFFVQAKNNVYGGSMVSQGQIIGYWHRTLSPRSVSVQFAPFRPLTPAETDGFVTAAQRYADHLALPLINTSF